MGQSTPRYGTSPTSWAEALPLGGRLHDPLAYDHPGCRLHSTDLEILERIPELRQPLFEIIGEQRRSDQIVGFLFVMDPARFFERLTPFLLAVVATPEPSQRQQLDTLRIPSPLIASSVG